MRRGVLAVATASVVATSACGGSGPGSSAPKGRSLFFIAFQRDPHARFAVLQRRLGTGDALNEYIKHTSSAVFAIPAGIAPGRYVAQGLFT